MRLQIFRLVAYLGNQMFNQIFNREGVIRRGAPQYPPPYDQHAQGHGVENGEPPPPGYGPPPPYDGPQGMPMPGYDAAGDQWMARPQGIPVCPPGLEYLCYIDQLLVKQQVEIFEIITGWETANRYKVQNSLGQQVYYASEESDTCARQCCGASRGFIIHITDNTGQEVIRVTREFKCGAGCPCFACDDSWAHVVQVEAPVGNIVGYVKQRQSCFRPYYIITDAEHQEVFSMTGPPCCYHGCTWDQDFVVNANDGHTQVGKVSKQWSGLLKEMFTDADNFGISFPVNLDVKLKAVMLGAVFLIDFMYYEKSQNSSSSNNRGSM
ncbi:phospholipid scramblase 2-like [Ruditapes philippinarum]|uniref:phospholipid scramblase 2-like n=1 Tax=Ruditapes philippinarum TaxID=129788 RepID=UPI00295BD47B|nr:phospholipid scramblase 2-like [Ruditapes philippinarum]